MVINHVTSPGMIFQVMGRSHLSGEVGIARLSRAEWDERNIYRSTNGEVSFMGSMVVLGIFHTFLAHLRQISLESRWLTHKKILDMSPWSLFESRSIRVFVKVMAI